MSITSSILSNLSRFTGSWGNSSKKNEKTSRTVTLTALAGLGIAYAGYKWAASRRSITSEKRAKIEKIQDPVATTTDKLNQETFQQKPDSQISVPDLPRNFTSEELIKISSLRNRTDVIAVTHVLNQNTSKWEPVYITYTPPTIKTTKIILPSIS